MQVLTPATHTALTSKKPETAQSSRTDLALDLLIKELGTEGARQFLRKEFAQYHRDYLGDGRDDRRPKIADYNPSDSAAGAHTFSR